MPNLAQDQSPMSTTDHFSLRRDLAAVVLIPAFVAAFAVYVELNEVLFAYTRRWEVLQVDELPVTLSALTLCLAWFAWRRFLDARRQLERRRVAEARLETLLLENRRLAQQYLQVQESERKLLAHELHDELGQYLNAIKIDAVAIQQRATGDTSPVLGAASAIIEHADHVHAVVRDLIGKLRPVGLEELGLKAAIERVSKGLSDPSMTIEDLIAQDDKVAVRLTSSATHSGEFMGMPASGKRYEIGEIHWFRIAGGKIAEHWHQADFLGMMRQLGAMPGGGGAMAGADHGDPAGQEAPTA